MKDYRLELDRYEYNSRYNVRKEHMWDSLKDDKEVKKFEGHKHENQKYEFGEDVFKTAKDLLTPTNDDIRQSSPEVTGQFEAKPFPEN